MSDNGADKAISLNYLIRWAINQGPFAVLLCLTMYYGSLKLDKFIDNSVAARESNLKLAAEFTKSLDTVCDAHEIACRDFALQIGSLSKTEEEQTAVLREIARKTN